MKVKLLSHDDVDVVANNDDDNVASDCNVDNDDDYQLDGLLIKLSEMQIQFCKRF